MWHTITVQCSAAQHSTAQNSHETNTTTEHWIKSAQLKRTWTFFFVCALYFYFDMRNFSIWTISSVSFRCYWTIWAYFFVVVAVVASPPFLYIHFRSKGCSMFIESKIDRIARENENERTKHLVSIWAHGLLTAWTNNSSFAVYVCVSFGKCE